MYTPDAEVDLSPVPSRRERAARPRRRSAPTTTACGTRGPASGGSPVRSSALGDDRYAMLVRIDAEGRGSGAPAGTEATIFYTLADGLIARAEFEPGRSPQLQG